MRSTLGSTLVGSRGSAMLIYPRSHISTKIGFPHERTSSRVGTHVFDRVHSCGNPRFHMVELRKFCTTILVQLGVDQHFGLMCRAWRRCWPPSLAMFWQVLSLHVSTAPDLTKPFLTKRFSAKPQSTYHPTTTHLSPSHNPPGCYSQTVVHKPHSACHLRRAYLQRGNMHLTCK